MDWTLYMGHSIKGGKIIYFYSIKLFYSYVLFLDYCYYFSSLHKIGRQCNHWSNLLHISSDTLTIDTW